MLSTRVVSPDVRDHSGNVCAWAKMLGFSFFWLLRKAGCIFADRIAVL